nr:putative chloroplast protein CP12 [Arabidopsis thaliana]
MTTIAAAGLNVATPRVVVRPVARVLGPVRLNYPWKFGSMKRMVVVKATSEGEISEKVEKKYCNDNPETDECRTYDN